MFSLFTPDFVKLSRELNALKRRDVTQGVKLAKYRSHMEAYREFRRKGRKERG